MMKTKRWLLTGLLLTTTIATASCAGLGAGRQDDEETFTVAYLYAGAIGEIGWSYTHDLGRQELEEALDCVETAYAENMTVSYTTSSAAAAVDSRRANRDRTMPKRSESAGCREARA